MKAIKLETMFIETKFRPSVVKVTLLVLEERPRIPVLNSSDPTRFSVLPEGKRPFSGFPRATFPPGRTENLVGSGAGLSWPRSHGACIRTLGCVLRKKDFDRYLVRFMHERVKIHLFIEKPFWDQQSI